MKSHIKISPDAPVSRVQTPDAPSIEFNLNAEDRAITARHGDDIIFGGEGDDILNGGPGQDALDGGPGNNVIIQD